jgi:hypothetical protein
MVSNKVLEGHGYLSFAGMNFTSGQTISEKPLAILVRTAGNLSEIQTGVLQ